MNIILYYFNNGKCNISYEKTDLNENLYKDCNDFKGERKKFLKNCQLTSYAIMFGQRTFSSIVKLVFRGKREFNLFHYNAIFKDRVLFK